MTSLRYMRLQALLPLLIHRGEPEVGARDRPRHRHHDRAPAGLSRTRAAGPRRTVARSREGGGAVRRNQNVATDRRVEVRVATAAELLRNAETYDLITLEPPPPPPPAW